MKPPLAICIPTFNRDYLLDKMLEQVVPIVMEFGIPIYISDNASPDNTRAVVSKYQALYSDINYYRQETNIGPDKNFEFLLIHSEARYKWLLSDSSYFLKQDLEGILRVLSSGDYDFVVVGSKDRTERLGSDRVYLDSNVLLQELGWHMTFVSCLIYSDSAIQGLNFERYYRSRFLQTGVIFEYIAFKRCQVFFLNSAKVKSIAIDKRDHWTSIAFEVFSKDWYLFVMSLPLSYSFCSKRKCILAHGKYFFTTMTLLSLRSRGYFSYKIFVEYYYFIRQTVAIPLMVSVAISILPRRPLSLLSTCTKQIRRGGRLHGKC